MEEGRRRRIAPGVGAAREGRLTTHLLALPSRSMDMRLGGVGARRDAPAAAALMPASGDTGPPSARASRLWHDPFVFCMVIDR